jgi:hypothetical protein
LELSGAVPNITTALRICVTLPPSVASGKRIFNALKQVKTVSTEGQDSFNGFATLDIPTVTLHESHIFLQ